jgi:hypothetical protein
VTTAAGGVPFLRETLVSKIYNGSLYGSQGSLLANVTFSISIRGSRISGQLLWHDRPLDFAVLSLDNPYEPLDLKAGNVT